MSSITAVKALIKTILQHSWYEVQGDACGYARVYCDYCDRDNQLDEWMMFEFDDFYAGNFEEATKLLDSAAAEIEHEFDCIYKLALKAKEEIGDEYR